MLDGVLFLFFKQKTAYEMLISDWSSDVCSSDLLHQIDRARLAGGVIGDADHQRGLAVVHRHQHHDTAADALLQLVGQRLQILGREAFHDAGCELQAGDLAHVLAVRSEEHTSELQSLMRISYLVLCLKMKTSNSFRHRLLVFFQTAYLIATLHHTIS